MTYHFYLEGTADWQWTITELGRLPSDTEVLHFGSIASWTAPGSELIVAQFNRLEALGGFSRRQGYQFSAEACINQRGLSWLAVEPRNVAIRNNGTAVSQP